MLLKIKSIFFRRHVLFFSLMYLIQVQLFFYLVKFGCHHHKIHIHYLPNWFDYCYHQYHHQNIGNLFLIHLIIHIPLCKYLKNIQYNYLKQQNYYYPNLYIFEL